MKSHRRVPLFYGLALKACSYRISACKKSGRIRPCCKYSLSSAEYYLQFLTFDTAANGLYSPKLTPRGNTARVVGIVQTSYIVAVHGTRSGSRQEECGQ